MNFISNLTLTVCVLSLVSTLLMMLVPDKYRRELRTVISLAAAVSVGTILLGADFSDIPLPADIDLDAQSAVQDSLIQKELENRLADYIKELLNDEGISLKKVEVGTTIDASRSIFITKASLWLDRHDAQSESRAEAKIKEKIGDVEIQIIYGDG